MQIPCVEMGKEKTVELKEDIPLLPWNEDNLSLFVSFTARQYHPTCNYRERERERELTG